MPELPEVETVKRGLAPYMEGRRLLKLELRRADLRFPFPDGFAKATENQEISALGRRSKYLLADLSNDQVIIMHLGMSGSFRIDGPDEKADPLAKDAFTHERGKLPAHDHVIFHLTGGIRVIYNDPRRFGFMTIVARPEFEDHPYIKNLGVEPTGNALNPDYLATAFSNKKAPIKSALLDQSIIAGLGNIYVCESLWRAKISPTLAAKSLVTSSGQSTKRLRALTDHIRDVIQEAIASGGSSLRDHVQASGELGYFQHQFSVYDKAGQPCTRKGCAGVITRIVQSNRSSFFCPSCQK